MRLIASQAALDVLLALEQAGELRLTDLARACGVGLSTAQRGMDVLLADGLAKRTDKGRYRSTATPTTRATVEIALQTRPLEALAQVIGRANAGVELIGVGSTRLIVVAGRHADIDERLRARRALQVVADRLEVEFVERQHDELRAHRVDFADERTGLANGSVLYGNLAVTYPPTRLRSQGGAPLGHLNPALVAPSAKQLRALSRRHNVQRLRVFGSAVRDDFRPDSDVDVAVDLKPGTPHRTLRHLEEDLERLLDRDVDVVLVSLMRDSVRKEVQEHGVSLLG
jgi:uncharacterized protein